MPMPHLIGCFAPRQWTHTGHARQDASASAFRATSYSGQTRTRKNDALPTVCGLMPSFLFSAMRF